MAREILCPDQVDTRWARLDIQAISLTRFLYEIFIQPNSSINSISLSGNVSVARFRWSGIYIITIFRMSSASPQCGINSNSDA